MKVGLSGGWGVKLYRYVFMMALRTLGFISEHRCWFALIYIYIYKQQKKPIKTWYHSKRKNGTNSF